MQRPSRREFLKDAGVALSAAALPGRAVAPGNAAYAAAVLAEPTLIGFWRLDGDLNPARGTAFGTAKGGTASYASGPIGGQALNCAPGRFVTMGPTPELDTPQSTVELFFQLTASPLPAYNPCLIAKRLSSPETRFSLHVWSDLTSLGYWNGQGVDRVFPTDGPLRIGRWYHLAVTSDGQTARAYLDGVECKLQGAPPFNRVQKAKPLVVGASSETGEEGCACTIAAVAIYEAALPQQVIARHLDAAGWGGKRRRLERSRDREAAEHKRRRQARLRQRLHDPRLMAPGKPRVYEGEHLDAIRFSLGGVGAGTIQMDGRAERAAWQIFNNFTGWNIPDSFFAVRVAGNQGEPVMRALQTTKAGPIPAMQRLKFRGEYPFAWYDFEDEALPVRVSLEAYTPFIPLDERASAIPCAVFNLMVENTTAHSLTLALLAMQQNAVGYNGEGPILARRGRGYGGNRNAALRMEDFHASILHFTSDRKRSGPTYGDMALALIAPDPETRLTALADGSDSETLLRFLQEDPLASATDGSLAAGPSPVGETLNGALAAHFRLKPGEKRTVRCLLTWHFPNARHGDPRRRLGSHRQSVCGLVAGCAGRGAGSDPHLRHPGNADPALPHNLL